MGKLVENHFHLKEEEVEFSYEMILYVNEYLITMMSVLYIKNIW
jgi:hypothetical protein